MRWLAIVVLGACSFSPGQLRSDANGSADTSGHSDAPDDTSMITIDTAPDTFISPIKVRSIDIVDAQVVGGPHADFPLLVKISAAWLKSVAHGGDVAGDTGADIYFTADAAGDVALPFEVESYDEMAGDLVAWVKVSLAAATVLYIHYGDVAIASSRATPTQVWTGGYALVVHYNGTGDASGNVAAVPATNAAATTGKIAVARSYNLDGYSDAGSATAIDDSFASGGTLEGWFNATGFGGNSRGRLFDKNQWGLAVENGVTTSSVTFFYMDNSGNGLAAWHFGANVITLNAWHHVALVFNGSNGANVPTAYIDGVAKTAVEWDQPAGQFYSDAGDTLYLGNSVAGDRGFQGTLDELRMSSGSRSDGWLISGYRNQNDPGAFYTVSAPL